MKHTTLLLGALGLVAALSTSYGVYRDPYCFEECSYPYELDEKSCSCVLIRKPICDEHLLCKYDCPYGVEVDSNGCDTCVCVERGFRRPKIFRKRPVRVIQRRRFLRPRRINNRFQRKNRRFRPRFNDEKFDFFPQH